jgi:hypothetical protein
VFSSNVLEHILHVDTFHAELRRVLKPGGVGVHLMPTPTWRVATLLAHYPHLCRAAALAAFGHTPQDTAVEAARAARTGKQWLTHALLASRHGELGNAISEIWLFSLRRWRRSFEHGGWQLAETRSNGVFYTGYTLLGNRLGFTARRLLSKVFGGSCKVYVVR